MLHPERPGVSVLTYMCGRKRPNWIYILNMWGQNGISVEQRYTKGGEELSDVVLALRSGMVIWKKVCNSNHAECIIHTTIFLTDSLAVTELHIVSKGPDDRVHKIMNINWSTTDVGSLWRFQYCNIGWWNN